MQPQAPPKPVMDVATPKRPAPLSTGSALPPKAAAQEMPIHEAPGGVEKSRAAIAAASTAERQPGATTPLAPGPTAPASTVPTAAITTAILAMISLSILALMVYFNT